MGGKGPIRQFRPNSAGDESKPRWDNARGKQPHNRISPSRQTVTNTGRSVSISASENVRQRMKLNRICFQQPLDRVCSSPHQRNTFFHSRLIENNGRALRELKPAPRQAEEMKTNARRGGRGAKSTQQGTAYVLVSWSLTGTKLSLMSDLMLIEMSDARGSSIS